MSKILQNTWTPQSRSGWFQGLLGGCCTHASTGHACSAERQVHLKDPVALRAGRDDASAASLLTTPPLPWHQASLHAASSLAGLHAQGGTKDDLPTQALKTQGNRTPPIFRCACVGPRRRKRDSEQVLRVISVSRHALVGCSTSSTWQRGQPGAPPTSLRPPGEFGRVGKVLQLGHARPQARRRTRRRWRGCRSLLAKIERDPLNTEE